MKFAIGSVEKISLFCTESFVGKSGTRKGTRIVEANEEAMSHLNATISNLSRYLSAAESAPGNDGIRDAVIGFNGIKLAWKAGKLTSTKAKNLVNRIARALTRAISSIENVQSLIAVDAARESLDAAVKSLEKFNTAMGWTPSVSGPALKVQKPADERTSHLTYVEQLEQALYRLTAQLAMAGIRFTVACSTVVYGAEPKADFAPKAEEVAREAYEAAEAEAEEPEAAFETIDSH